jgi:flagellar M-ring protein FliF
MAGVAVGLIGFFAFLMARLSTPDMEVLYGNLAPGDAGAIVAELEAQNIAYRVTETAGVSRISVSGDQVARVRMALAQKGLPNSGTIGNEIFDKDQGFGATNFIQNMNRLRALEGELTRTLTGLNKVGGARVHIVMPDREMFSRRRQEPSASVTLSLRGQLSEEQIAAVQHLVAAAVPDLSPGRVTVVDSAGSLLARGMGEDEGGFAGGTAERLRRQREETLRHSIEDLVAPYFGDYNAFRVTVSADMDFDQLTTSSEEFDPNVQVVRSSQTREEESSSSEGGGSAGGAVTVGNNVPGGAGFGDNSAGGSTGHTTEETTNYEINRTQRTLVRESGQINRLSAAVLVDYAKVPNAEDPAAPPASRPRTDEEMTAITNLVKSAIGYNQQRGDTVVVTSLEFNAPEQPPVEAASALPFGLDSGDLKELTQLLIMGILGILVLLLVVRPLVAKALSAPPRPAPAADDGYAMLTDQSMGMGIAGALPRPDGGTAMVETGSRGGGGMQAPGAGGSELESMINISQVEGRVRASSLKKIGEIVDKHPEEAVSIIRTWMQQEGAG